MFVGTGITIAGFRAAADSGPAPVPGAWDLSNATLAAGETFDASGQTSIMNHMTMSTDGTQMYLLDTTSLTSLRGIEHYELSTAWNPSTATHVQRSNAIYSQDTAPTGYTFKPDGTKMYMVGIAGDSVYEYDLGTAWDVSTLSYVQAFSVSAQDGNPFDVFFKTDGTKMYVLGGSGDDVNEYDLSAAWDVSSASYLQNFSVAAQDTSPSSLFFKPDGTKMFIDGQAGDTVEEYDLSTAWDVSSASHVQSLSVAAQGNPCGIFWKPEGDKLLLGTTGEDVFAFDVTSA